MNIEQIALLAALVLGSFSVALLALYGIAWLSARSENLNAITLSAHEDELVFLFDEETLVNATNAAKTILTAAADVGSDWSKLLSVLIARFPSLQTEIGALADRGTLTIESRDGNAVLNCEWRNGLARIALVDQENETSGIHLDRHSISAMEHELDGLRSITEAIPFPVWRMNVDGSISWANPAYMALADQGSTELETQSWPPRAVFAFSEISSLALGEIGRFKVERSDEEHLWFDVKKLQVGQETLFAAASSDKAVKAENSLREFTQTLTKTFSHLTIGLAVFDKNRKLALFNPALSDLTTLGAEFLASQPELTSFLDKLRDAQMMPEPKDYKTWRQEISELEAAAENGSYSEVWSLAGGTTYRVTGRPHPDGAIAFLFEDISAEMSLTRRFRSEIETGQAVLNSLDEAVAVFSATDELILSNSAYTSLWGTETLEGISESTISDATRLWHSKCAPTPLWSDIRNYSHSIGDRQERQSSVRLWDGRKLNCRVSPLPGGQTLVGFKPSEAAQNGPAISRPQADTVYVNV